MAGISNIPIGLPFMGASNGLTSGLNIVINGETINSINSPTFIDVTALGNVLISGNIVSNAAISSTGNISSGAIISALQINNNMGTAILTGITAGTIEYSMPERGTFKKFIIYFSAYENDTTTAQIITFPVAFSHIPSVNNQSGITGVVVSASDILIDPDVTTSWTGYFILEGY